MNQQSTTALIYIAVSLSEVAAVPGVRDIIAASCECEELIDFTVLVTSENTHHIADICGVHTDEEVVLVIV